jgi:hypothetical protein
LEEDDRVLLSIPPNRDDLVLQRLPDSPVIEPDSTSDRPEAIELDPSSDSAR